jgi:hypothetical protein
MKRQLFPVAPELSGRWRAAGMKDQPLALYSLISIKYEVTRLIFASRWEPPTQHHPPGKTDLRMIRPGERIQVLL